MLRNYEETFIRDYEKNRFLLDKKVLFLIHGRFFHEIFIQNHDVSDEFQNTFWMGAITHCLEISNLLLVDFFHEL